MVDDTEEQTSIVVDNGSYKLRAGWSGNDEPNHTFRSYLGTLKHQTRECDKTIDDISLQENFIGSDAQINRELLSLRYPIERGIVKHWDDMELIWKYLYDNALHVKPDDYPIFITDAQYNPILNRQKMVEVLFERFNAPACQISSSAQMLIEGVLRTRLLVVDCGHSTTQTAMQYEGWQKPEVNQRRDFGGIDVTTYLQQLLRNEGYNFSTSYEMELVNDMKERFCTFEPTRDSEVIFSTPGGGEITLSSKIFKQAAECVFNPQLAGFEQNDCVTDIIVKMFEKSGPDLVGDLLGNIVVSGGNSRIPGFSNRLKEELKWRLPHLKYLRVNHCVNYGFHDDTAVWQGGSTTTSLSCFEDAWIQREQYNEYGPAITNRRCL